MRHTLGLVAAGLLLWHANVEASSERLRYPVIMVHGFNASPESPTGFSAEVIHAVERRAPKVVVPQLNPYATSETRGRELAKVVRQVMRETGATKVHIIGHSQGGLDARWLASPEGGNMGSSIASILSLSSPHHGMPLANTLVKSLGGDTRIKRVVRGTILKLLSLRLNPAARKDFTWDAVGGLSEMSVGSDFNAKVPDHPGVKYSSAGGTSQMTPRGKKTAKGHTHALLWGTALMSRGASDGTVPTASARWGTWLGALPADHYAIIGQGPKRGKDKLTGFDPLAFYSKTVFHQLRQAEAGKALAKRPPRDLQAYLGGIPHHKAEILRNKELRRHVRHMPKQGARMFQPRSQRK
ncbi:MAG: alpha/beta fold hydrolase [Deltaproteobacteria bacterium]|nr:alpha/beta fold hydrolase [Deltaproteobacteria bacterium]